MTSQVAVNWVSNLVNIRFEIFVGAKVHDWSENMVRKDGRENNKPMKRLGASFIIHFKIIGLPDMRDILDEADYEE